MDQIDRKIIGELQRDGRLSMTDLAERLPLSLSATSERFRRLLDSGIISGFVATVDQELAGRTINAIIDVRFRPGTYSPAMDFDLPELAAVVDAMHITGRFDVQLRVATRDVAELDRLLLTLTNDLDAEETNTRLILRTIDGFPRSVSVA
ncbi:MAG: Lrp/AsnC family transcriptional regulator [Actinomycetota bacterium]